MSPVLPRQGGRPQPTRGKGGSRYGGGGGTYRDPNAAGGKGGANRQPVSHRRSTVKPSSQFDSSQFRDYDFGNLPGIYSSQYRGVDRSNVPDTYRSSFVGVDSGKLPGFHDSRFQQLNTAGLPGYEGLPGLRSAGVGGVSERGGLAADLRRGAADRQRQYGLLGERFRGYENRVRDLNERYDLADAESFGPESQRITDAMFQRGINLRRPGDERARADLENRLYQRGLAPGSEAYNEEMNRLQAGQERARNDLSLASVIAGSQEHERLANLNARNRAQMFGEAGAGFDRAGALFDAGAQPYAALSDSVGQQEAMNRARMQEGLAARGQRLAERGQEFQERLAGTNIANQVERDIFNQAAQRRGQMFGEDVTAANMENAAQQNMFAQALANRGQIFGENMQDANLFNQIQSNLFDQSMRRRGLLGGEERAAVDRFNQNEQALFDQSLGRYAGISNRIGANAQATNAAAAMMRAETDRQAQLGMLPFQQFGALGSSGMLNMTGFAAPQVSAPDVMGMIGSNYAANANRQAAGLGGLLSAGGSIGAALLSDRRLKENVKRVGTLDNGLPVYTYNVIGVPVTQMGVMADEAEKVVPEAVIERNGIKRVRYDLVA